MKFLKYFFEFLSIISLLLIFKIIGLIYASNLGSFIGKLIGPIFRSKSVVKKNLKIFKQNISDEEIKLISNKMWSNIGRTFSEYVYLKKFNQDLNNNLIKIINLKYLSEIKKENKPVIFISGHFANFELMAMKLNQFIKLAAIYRPLNNFLLNPIMEYLRIKYICPNQIKKGKSGLRQILQNFNNGYSIALMIDQRVSEGISINFFNEPALTTTIPAQLVLRYNCKVVPLSIKRINNINFEITIEQPIEFNNLDNNTENIKKITLKLNQELEKMIINNTSQWIWTHNRWK